MSASRDGSSRFWVASWCAPWPFRPPITLEGRLQGSKFVLVPILLEECEVPPFDRSSRQQLRMMFTAKRNGPGPLENPGADCYTRVRLVYGKAVRIRYCPATVSVEARANRPLGFLGRRLGPGKHKSGDRPDAHRRHFRPRWEGRKRS